MAPHWNRGSGAATVNGDSGATALDLWNSARLSDEPLQLQLGPVPAPTSRLRLDYNVTALSGTTPGIQFVVETHWGDGLWRVVWTSPVITATTGSVQTKFMGPGYDNTWPGPAGRVRWLITGSGGPSVTFTATLRPVP